MKQKAKQKNKPMIFIIIGVLLVAAYLLYSQVLSKKITKTIDTRFTQIKIGLNTGNTIISDSPDTTTKIELSYTDSKPIILADQIVIINATKSGHVKLHLFIPKDIPIDLSYDANAGNFTFESKNNSVKASLINIGAGNLLYTLQNNVSSSVDIVVGAGNVHVLAPSTLGGLRLTIPNTELQLGDKFVKTGDTLESTGYADAPVKADVKVVGGSANFTIDSF